MPAPHRKISRTEERRKRRRQRRESQPDNQPSIQARSPVTRPVQLSSRAVRPAKTTSAVASLDRETEYRLTRQDLWRLAIYSTICLALMIGVLFVVEG